MPITVAVESGDPTWTPSCMEVVGDDGASGKRSRTKKTNRQFGGRLASLCRSLFRSPEVFWLRVTPLIGVVSGQTEEYTLVNVVLPWSTLKHGCVLWGEQRCLCVSPAPTHSLKCWSCFSLTWTGLVFRWAHSLVETHRVWKADWLCWLLVKTSCDGEHKAHRSHREGRGWHAKGGSMCLWMYYVCARMYGMNVNVKKRTAERRVGAWGMVLCGSCCVQALLSVVFHYQQKRCACSLSHSCQDHCNLLLHNVSSL